MKPWLWAGAAAALLVLACGLMTATVHAQDAPDFNPLQGSAQGTPVPQLTQGQTHYMISCGGCHGVLGSSARHNVPELHGSVGKLLCTQAGREYVVRLPNVAFAGVDDQVLAEILNYVVLSFSDASLPQDFKPYTATEVGKLRHEPNKNTNLWNLRQAILAQTDPACGQPKSATPVAAH